MTTFWFVRHGPTHAKTMVGWSDLPADLSDTDAIARLSNYLPDAPVVSSDLKRARDTAAALAGDRALWSPVPALREINFGAWELQRHDQIEDQALARKFWDFPGDIAPPQGESWNQLRHRVTAATEDLRGAGHADIIVVCHFGAILTQVQRALGLTGTEVFAHRIDPLSVTRITFADPNQVHQINHNP